MLKRYHLFICGLGLLLAPAITHSMDKNNSLPEYRIEPVKVTAQKREENLKEVPMAMDAFSDADLENAGITNYKEATRFSPNVYMREATPESVTIIRGMSTFDGSIFAPVGFYVDDISYSMHHSHSLELMDIQRIEILKGPQGTLYGRNSSSGVINIITQTPGNDFQGKIKGSYSAFNTRRISADIKGPIIRDRLFAGISGLYKKSDGYMTNIYNNDDKAAATESKTGKFRLRWTPSELTDISLAGDAMEAENMHGYYHYLTGEDGTSYGQVNLNRGDIPPEMTHSGAALRISHRFNAFDFLSVTGFRRFKNFFAWDADMGRPNLGPIAGDRLVNHHFDNDSLSQEFRFFSKKPKSRLKWLLGAFAFKEDTDTFYNTLATARQVPIYDPRTRMEVKGYALFGESTYGVTEKFKITAGLRFDHHKLKGDVWVKNNWVYPNAGQAPPYNSFSIRDDNKNNEWLPKLSAAYHLTGDAMVYATVSRGFQSGGYNYFMPGSLKDFAFDKETSQNYEIGAKTTWFNKRLSTDLALFYAEVSDKQVQETSAFNPLFAAIANADKVRVKGGEISLRARPLSGLDLGAGFGYTDSVFEKYTARTPSGFKDVSGNKVPDVPAITYHIGAQYTFENGFYARCDLTGIGKAYADVDNTATLGPYDLVNLRMGYIAEKYEISLFATNLFDEKYAKYKVATGDGSEIGVNGEPRALGITCTFRF